MPLKPQQILIRGHQPEDDSHQQSSCCHSLVILLSFFCHSFVILLPLICLSFVILLSRRSTSVTSSYPHCNLPLHTFLYVTAVTTHAHRNHIGTYSQIQVYTPHCNTQHHILYRAACPPNPTPHRGGGWRWGAVGLEGEPPWKRAGGSKTPPRRAYTIAPLHSYRTQYVKQYVKWPRWAHGVPEPSRV